MPNHKGEDSHSMPGQDTFLEEFADLAATAGWIVKQVWMDAQELFSVQYFTVQA